MEQNNPGISCAFYTVRQLAALFGKSEDTIRRWKNEGIGREDDNIKLRAVEREDGSGRKNARHLVFSREAVIEFVKANPFLMDDAPQLGLMMQAEGAWKGGALPMPGEVSDEEPERRETGFAAQVRRIISEFEAKNSPESAEDGFFRTERSRFGGASRRTAQDSFGFDDEPADNEDFFSHGRHSEDFDPWPEWEDMDQSGWRRRMPRGPGCRKAADEELERRMKTVDFALGILRQRVADMHSERTELEDAMTELDISDMEEKTVASIKRVLRQKKAELEHQMDMLEEFVAVIEEEMKDS